MQKILLDTDNEALNQRQVLRSINSSGMSRKNMSFNFIKAGDKYWCLFTTCDDERNALPDELKSTSITYKNLKAKTLS
jgi:acyl-[acyl carrier protein]--UDP-N-acetylglucosamine O-acyltransferase